MVSFWLVWPAKISSMSESEFESSKLGTKEFWDSTYEKELANYVETKDIGEVWFGYDSVSRIVTWLNDSDTVTTSSCILDIGCGNGFTLIELAKEGYKNLTGIDYSEHGVNLARSIAEQENLDITYEVCDVLESNSSMTARYDVCLDKGTFDAISLSPSDVAERKQTYAQNVHSFLKDKGIFLLASCNWTESELKDYFNKGFHFLEKISTPTFTFGGMQGNRETILVFQKI